MLTREEIHAAMIELGMARIAPRISELFEPCVLVRTHPHPYEFPPLGCSRIGGLPDLPTTVEWPTWRERPLAFLAQFNLDDLNRFPCCQILPPSGYLWFFYDAEQRAWGFDPQDRGSWRVVYADASREDLRSRNAEGLPTRSGYQPCRLTFHDFLSIPGPEHLLVAPLHLTLEEIEGLEEIERDMHDMIESRSPEPFEPHHQLLGHPKVVQGEMQLECQLASNGVYRSGASRFENPPIHSLEAGAADWRLLFQLDTDDDGSSGKPGMMWGDCGKLYFWIRHQDLANRDFSNTWMVLQCS